MKKTIDKAKYPLIFTKDDDIRDLEMKIEGRERDLRNYQTLLKGGTVQKGSVSEGRYKDYIYKIREELKKLKKELTQAKK